VLSCFSRHIPVSTLFYSLSLHDALPIFEGTTRIPLAGVLTGISPYLEADMPFGYLRGTKSLRDDEGNLLINPATGALIEDAIDRSEEHTSELQSRENLVCSLLL